MLETIAVTSATDLARFCSLWSSPPLAQPEGDEHLLTLLDGEVQARCSLWWRALPALDGTRLGYIGHFAALSGRAARELLEAACRHLARESCARAVGPIDGTTWRRYRLVTERGDEPPFFLEPDNPAEWPGYFTSAGFRSIAHYTSALDTSLREIDPRIPEITDRMRGLDITIRPIDPAQFEEEVDRIYDVSVASFRSAFLYSLIDRAACHSIYAPLRQYVRPELALIAERNETPVGFVFALPDWAQAQRGSAIDTAIVKTLAIVPQQEYSGLGSLLLSRCRSRIADLGYARAIHALMYDGNVGSRRLSDRFGQTMRGYTLFAREVVTSE